VDFLTTRALTFFLFSLPSSPLHRDAYGKRTVLQQFGPGQWFGECTWNYNQDQIQPVTVYALQKTTILYTSSYQFAAALQQFPQLSVAINVMNPDGDGLAGLLPTEDDTGEDPSYALKHSAETGPRSLGIGAPIQIQLKNIPFFADIDELKLQQLAMLCEIKKKKAGTWICRQGADADGFYYIIKGRVEVSAHGFLDVEQLMSSGGGDLAAASAGSNRSYASDHKPPVSPGGPKHRGSGQLGYSSTPNRPDDSPNPRNSGRGTVLLAPSTPLTQGLTPSPPSTPNQRPHPSSTRRSFPNVQSGGGLPVKRGGSFSASVKEERGEYRATYEEKDGGMSEYSNATQPPSPKHSAYLDTLRAGDWFGEIALLEKTTRTASVQATQDCILLYLSRERFIRFLKFAPSIKSSSIFTDLIRKRTANSLKCLPIFAPLKIKTVGSHNQFDEKRLALLGGMFHYLSVPANTNIFNEGDFGMAFYIVIQGVCIVTAKAADGEEEVFLNELRDNDYFGESSLLNKVRCNATVKTKTNCLLLKLSGENFQKFLQVAPEVEDLFRQRVNMRTSERLKNIPFFRNVRENKPWSKLDLLGALFTFEEFSMNEVVFNQGTIGTKFYIIVSGEIEISVAKEKDSGESTHTRQILEILTHNNPNEYGTGNGGAQRAFGDGTSVAPSSFGEIALMRKTARTATARCVSPNGAVLLSIDSVKFQKFLTIAPELSEDFTSLLIHRTSNLLKSFDLFKQVLENKPWSKMEMIASLFNYELFEGGQGIYSLGDPAEKFYVIASGTVRLESVWAGVQTMHSQSAFGAMELMKNQMQEKAWKQQKLKIQKQVEERRELPDGGASLPPLVLPAAPVPVVRTHSAKAVELCGLMVMPMSSFKSLLTIAPEIIPYFSAIAEHEHRRASEIGLTSNPAIMALREQMRAKELERASQLQQSSDLGLPEMQHKDSISALVLPPTNPQARGRVADDSSPASDDNHSSGSSVSGSPVGMHRGRVSEPRQSETEEKRRYISPSESPVPHPHHDDLPTPLPDRDDEREIEQAATRLHTMLQRNPSPAVSQDLTDLGATKPPPSPTLHAVVTDQFIPDLPVRKGSTKGSPHIAAMSGTKPPVTASVTSNGATVAAAAATTAINGVFVSALAANSPSNGVHKPATSVAHPPRSTFPSHSSSSSLCINGEDDEESGKAWLLASSIVITGPTPAGTRTSTPLRGPEKETVSPPVLFASLLPTEPIMPATTNSAGESTLSARPTARKRINIHKATNPRTLALSPVPPAPRLVGIELNPGPPKPSSVSTPNGVEISEFCFARSLTVVFTDL
jgi:CRP-like cAMP-binding protein